MHILPILARDCPIFRDVPLMIGSPEKTTPDGKKGQVERATNIETDDDPIPRGHNIFLTTPPRNNDMH